MATSNTKQPSDRTLSLKLPPNGQTSAPRMSSEARTPSDRHRFEPQPGVPDSAKRREETRYDIVVFIGRFEPFHRGHQAVIQRGLERGKTCVVLVGSAFEARSIRNPFTTSERIGMIRKAFLGVDDKQLCLEPLEDSNYNLNEWIENCQTTVQRVAKARGMDKPRIALIGHTKDATSYYLNLFPNWASIEVPNDEDISATSIRERIFPLSIETPKDFSLVRGEAQAEAMAWLNQEKGREGGWLPASTVNFLEEFIQAEAWDKIMLERQFVQKYQNAWSKAPYPVTFVTADAVVVQSGHLLVIKRQGFPGHGLWALPGGFINQDERIEEAALRELKEETGIKIPKAVLRGHIVTSKVFDAPFRSSRGRTITTAFLIHLEPGELPKIRAKDGEGEVAKTAWVPLASLRREDFFEDHYSIIQNLVHQI